jgi:hypothetical protein
VEKEAGENKRLSMENEQLNWRMTQESSLVFRQANQLPPRLVDYSSDRWLVDHLYEILPSHKWPKSVLFYVLCPCWYSNKEVSWVISMFSRLHNLLKKRAKFITIQISTAYTAWSSIFLQLNSFVNGIRSALRFFLLHRRMNIFTKRPRKCCIRLKLLQSQLLLLYLIRRGRNTTFFSTLLVFIFFVREVVNLPALADEKKALSSFLQNFHRLLIFRSAFCYHMHFSYCLSALFKIRHCIMNCIEYRAKSRKCCVYSCAHCLKLFPRNACLASWYSFQLLPSQKFKPR